MNPETLSPLFLFSCGESVGFVHPSPPHCMLPEVHSEAGLLPDNGGQTSGGQCEHRG